MLLVQIPVTVISFAKEDYGLRAGHLKDHQQSPNLDCNQLPEIGDFLLRLIGMTPKGFRIWRGTQCYSQQIP